MTYLEEQLGQSLSVLQVSQYLLIDPKTVRKYYRELGGVRFGRTYRFFSKELKDALQTWKQVVRPSNEVRQENVQNVQNENRGKSLGGRTKKKQGDSEDRHNIFT